MEKKLAKEIITEYVFGDFKLEAIDKFVDSSIRDVVERNLYAEALLTKALQMGIVALTIPSKKEVIENCILEIKSYAGNAYDWSMEDKCEEGSNGYIEQGLYEAVERLQMLID